MNLISKRKPAQLEITSDQENDDLFLESAGIGLKLDDLTTQAAEIDHALGIALNGKDQDSKDLVKSLKAERAKIDDEARFLKLQQGALDDAQRRYAVGAPERAKATHTAHLKRIADTSRALEAEYTALHARGVEIEREIEGLRWEFSQVRTDLGNLGLGGFETLPRAPHVPRRPRSYADIQRQEFLRGSEKTTRWRPLVDDKRGSFVVVIDQHGRQQLA